MRPMCWINSAQSVNIRGAVAGGDGPLIDRRRAVRTSAVGDRRPEQSPADRSPATRTTGDDHE